MFHFVCLVLAFKHKAMFTLSTLIHNFIMFVLVFYHFIGTAKLVSTNVTLYSWMVIPMVLLEVFDTTE